MGLAVGHFVVGVATRTIADAHRGGHSDASWFAFGFVGTFAGGASVITILRLRRWLRW